MKLTLNTTYTTASESQSLLILVDSEQQQTVKTIYKINDLDSLAQATQFKAGFNEVLPLIGKVPAQINSTLIGLDKATELKAAKLAKIAQTIIKASQKKCVKISVDISAVPAELHYLLALNLTQAAYAYDEYKSKKNEFALNHIELIATYSPLTAQQLSLIEAVQNGQNFARDLGNCPGNICFPEYLAEQALALAEEFPDLLKVTVLEE